MSAVRLMGCALLAMGALACGTGPAVEPEPAARGERADGETALNEFDRDPASVVGVEWHWHETITPVERIEVDEPSRYTIRLGPDGELTARFDCNRGGGSYEIGEGRLSFGPLFSTKMGCPPGSLDGRFSKDLGEVTSFFVRGGELYLELPMDSGTLRFRRG